MGRPWVHRGHIYVMGYLRLGLVVGVVPPLSATRLPAAIGSLVSRLLSYIGLFLPASEQLTQHPGVADDFFEKNLDVPPGAA
jgi:hypothetical protein